MGDEGEQEEGMGDPRITIIQEFCLKTMKLVSPALPVIRPPLGGGGGGGAVADLEGFPRFPLKPR